MAAVSSEWVDVRKLEETGRRAIETRLPEVRTTLARYPFRPTGASSGTFFRNMETLAVISAALGREPSWVRTFTAERQLSRRPLIPPAAWWSAFTIATLVEDVSVVDRLGAPFLHRVRFYYLEPHDLLDHSLRNGEFDRPHEAVDWPPPVPVTVDLQKLPSPAPRTLAREMVRAWLKMGRARRLP